MKSDQTQRIDIYAEITSAVIEAIEAGAGLYEMPLNRKFANTLIPLAYIPVNAVTKQSYRAQVHSRCGYVLMREVMLRTAQLWEGLGGRVRRGEMGTHVAFWKCFNGASDSLDADDQVETAVNNRPLSLVTTLCSIPLRWMVPDLVGYLLAKFFTAAKDIKSEFRPFK